MTRKIALIAALSLAGPMVNAQSSLQDQISAVNKAQTTIKAEQAAREAEQHRQMETREAEERAKAERRRAGAVANQRAAEARAREVAARTQAAAAAKEQERLKDK